MSDAAEGDVQVHDELKEPPEWSPAARQLFLDARSAGRTARIISAPTGAEKAMVKRRHDVRAALRTFGFTVEALRDGYTFQDASAAAKIEAIAKALQVLEREGELLTRLLPG